MPEGDENNEGGFDFAAAGLDKFDSTEKLAKGYKALEAKLGEKVEAPDWENMTPVERARKVYDVTDSTVSALDGNQKDLSNKLIKDHGLPNSIADKVVKEVFSIGPQVDLTNRVNAAEKYMDNAVNSVKVSLAIEHMDKETIEQFNRRLGDGQVTMTELKLMTDFGATLHGEEAIQAIAREQEEPKTIDKLNKRYYELLEDPALYDAAAEGHATKKAEFQRIKDQTDRI